MQRENTSITAKFEAIILDYLVARLPRWVSPDVLTLGAFFAAVLGFFGYIFAYHNSVWLLVINVCLIIHWLGDALDGRLARFRECERPNYGYYIDHVLDTATAVLFLGGLESSALTQSSAWGWVLAFMLIAMVHVFLKTKATGVFTYSVARISPSDARIFLFCINGAIFLIGNPHFIFINFIELLPFQLSQQIIESGGKIIVPLTLFDIVGWLIAIPSIAIISFQVIKTAIALDRSDRNTSPQ